LRFSPFVVCWEIFQRFAGAKEAFLWCLHLLHFVSTKEKNRRKKGRNLYCKLQKTSFRVEITMSNYRKSQ
jgi:hypothetical protein